MPHTLGMGVFSLALGHVRWEDWPVGGFAAGPAAGEWLNHLTDIATLLVPLG